MRVTHFLSPIPKDEYLYRAQMVMLDLKEHKEQEDSLSVAETMYSLALVCLLQYRVHQDHVDQLAHLELMALQEREESVASQDSRVTVEQRFENAMLTFCNDAVKLLQGERGTRGAAGQDGRPGERVSMLIVEDILGISMAMF